jgi:hypothetical protein
MKSHGFSFNPFSFQTVSPKSGDYNFSSLHDPNISPYASASLGHGRRHMGIIVHDHGDQTSSLAKGLHVYNPDTGQLDHHERASGLYDPIKSTLTPLGLRTIPQLPLSDRFRKHHELVKHTSIPHDFEHAEGLRQYSVNSIDTNNALLRDEEPSPIHADMIKHIRGTHSEITQPMSVFSGARGLPRSRFIDERSPNPIFHQKSFISATTHLPVAQKFAPPDGIRGRPGTGPQTILKFNLPAGFKRGTYMANHSEFPDEFEYLLHNDQKWRYLRTTTHNIYNSVFSAGTPGQSTSFDVHHFEPLEE